MPSYGTFRDDLVSGDAGLHRTRGHPESVWGRYAKLHCFDRGMRRWILCHLLDRVAGAPRHSRLDTTARNIRPTAEDLARCVARLEWI